MADAPCAVDIQQVSKSYGGQAVLSGLDLQLAAGESLALIGHNGAGKTSLLKLILGLSRPSCGVVQLWGHPAQERLAGIGFLPEVISFPGAMTGWEVLRFLARLKKQPTDQCTGLLEQMGLADAADRKIKTWSKGMRQRLGLAQALLGKPRLLILDEPTTGLDPDLRRDLYRIIHERQRQGTTIIIATHSLHQIDVRIDRVALLKRGRFLVQGGLHELCDRAGLENRVRLWTTPERADEIMEKFGARYSGEKIAGDQVTLHCRNADKITLLQGVIDAAGGALKDLEVHAPGLDELYHFHMQTPSSAEASDV